MGSIVISRGEAPPITLTHDQFLQNEGTFDISHLPFNDQTIREANGGGAIRVSHHDMLPSGNIDIEGVFSQQLTEGRKQEIVVSPIPYGFPDSVIQQIDTGYRVFHERS